MGRPTGSSGSQTSEAIRRAGLQLIYQHGYDAMTLRQLAREVGLTQASIYNHIATKQDLLFALINDHMKDLLTSADLALASAQSPSERLAAFVEFHVTYHTDRKREVFTSYSELRSLEPDNYRIIIEMRETYEKKLIAILAAGAADRTFEIADPRVTAFGILSMITGICTWYNPKGKFSKTQISDMFVKMVRGAVYEKRDPGRR